MEQTGLRPSFLSSIKCLLREPLLHFLLLGLALFAAYDYLPRSTRGAESSRQIVLTSDDLRHLAASFELEQRRRPTSEEFNRLVKKTVQEEVLYREALEMGLDKKDAIIKSRLAEKMEYLAKEDSAVREPTTAELKAWFAQHSNKFMVPNRVSFCHLYFSADRRGPRAHGDALEVLARIAGEPKDSKLAASLADPFMFQDCYSDATPEKLNQDFGPQFGRAISLLKPGSWQGPIESDHGWHLLFLDSLTPGPVPAFDEIETEIRNAWMDDQKSQAWQQAYDQIRAKYLVRLPGAATQEAANEAASPKSGKKPASPGEEPL